MIALGAGVGGVIGFASAKQGEWAGLGLAVVVGGGFIGFGLALLFKTFGESFEVSEEGIRKLGPKKVVLFQCPWEDIESYTSHTSESNGRSYRNIRDYTLSNRMNSVKISTYDSFFPELHSHILSSLPATARVTLGKTHAPGNTPMGPPRTWTTVSRLQIWHVLFFIVLGALLIFFGLQEPAGEVRIGGSVATDEQIAALRYGLIGVGAAILLLCARALLTSKRSVIKLTRAGVERHVGSRQDLFLPWEKVQAIESLYTFYPGMNDNFEDDGVRWTKRIPVTHFAVVGRDGDALCFDSNMNDFRGFYATLTQSAPEHVAIRVEGLHSGV